MTTTSPHATDSRASAPTTPATGLYRAFQACSLLAVLAVLFQFVTAGQLFGPGGGPETAHSAGAIVLHVLSGLAAVTAFLLWRRKQVPRGLLVLAVVVFGFTFVQAAMGGRSSLYVHVPGAMILTAGVTWLLVAALRARRG
jgi:hypothetical protein